jgi:hypothetical protein
MEVIVDATLDTVSAAESGGNLELRLKKTNVMQMPIRMMML